MIVQSKDNGYWCSNYGFLKESVEWMDANNFIPMSAKKLAEVRLHVGPYAHESWTGTLVTEHIGFEGSKCWLIESQYSFDEPVRSMEIHADHQEIPWNGEGKRVELDSTTELLEVIGVSEMSEHPITKYLFGSQTEAYADMLLEQKIDRFPVALPPQSLRKHSKPFMRPVIIRCLDNWSGLITANADLHKPYGHRGWASAWAGDVTLSQEVWSRAEIKRLMQDWDVDVSELLDLPDFVSVAELEKLFSKAGIEQVFALVLRVLRAGSPLPVNYESWAS